MKIVDEKNFKTEVLNAEFAVVDFYADWCGPCRVIAPLLDEIRSELNVEIVKVNIDESPDIATQYNVMSIPTLMIFKRGEKSAVIAGATSKTRLIDWISSHLQREQC
ncbi:MAG: thioredoxin [Holosporaceae bacterium]|jgi:thioredoxin 1|nr:thioredoxin [Holosporaceae bacterium]